MSIIPIIVIYLAMQRQFVAIADVRPGLAARVTRRYGVPHVYPSAAEMLAHERLDGIVASQPYARHGPTHYYTTPTTFEHLTAADAARRCYASLLPLCGGMSGPLERHQAGLREGQRVLRDNMPSYSVSDKESESAGSIDARRVGRFSETLSESL